MRRNASGVTLRLRRRLRVFSSCFAARSLKAEKAHVPVRPAPATPNHTLTLGRSERLGHLGAVRGGEARSLRASGGVFTVRELHDDLAVVAHAQHRADGVTRHVVVIVLPAHLPREEKAATVVHTEP